MHITHNADFLWREALEAASEVCKTTQLAEDAACYAFNYVITNQSKWDGRPMRNWIGIIARNKALSLKRELKRFSDIDVHEHHLTDETEDCFDHTVLHRALAQLRPNDLEVIIQHYFEGIELQVIAERLNQPESTVKVRAMRARNRLKDLL